jgi:DNA adenine methylase
VGVVKPPLKWAGGKRWLVPLLRQIYQQFPKSRLVEPFAGGLAVSLGIVPKRALLNDINPHAINFYRNLQIGLDVSLRMKNDRNYYERARVRFNKCIRAGNSSTAVAAQLFYYLNRTGFNGLCRFNSSGYFNVPFGRYAQIGYRQDFSEYQATLAPWRFCCGDFEDLKIRSGDFVYADPPYDVEFTRYATQDFAWEDQLRLATWLSSLAVPVVVSNQATKRILKLYRSLGFGVCTLAAPRMISCNGDRSPALEILAYKNIDKMLVQNAVRKHRTKVGSNN